jgi:hypothetical protein
VAYESQLKTDRAALHRRLADVIAVKASVGNENAALIAEHLQAAGDLRAAYDWHMRAAAWSARSSCTPLANKPGAAMSTTPSTACGPRSTCCSSEANSHGASLPARIFVETLLDRGGEDDLAEAEAVVDRMATAPLEMASEFLDLWLLRTRAPLADARGDESVYRDYRDRYRATAASLGFEGHMQWAQELP